MAKPNVRLAESLKVLRRFQDKHGGVVESLDLTETHRARLVEAGFLRPVIKGWYICANPAATPGDTTAWFASYWPFLSGYLGKRFGKHYCLNAEVSLALHTGVTTVPRQITVVTKEGGASKIDLPHGISIMIYTDSKNVPGNRIEVKGLQVQPLPDALCRAGPNFFRNHPREAEIALAMVRDPGELLTFLLSGDGYPAAAGRIAGAYRFLGKPGFTERIVTTMKRAAYEVRESNPFDTPAPTLLSGGRERWPYVLRLRSMWESWRGDVIKWFPRAPGLPRSPQRYLANVAERYVADAYNSLSIEGYQVTEELIQRVARGGWNPDTDAADSKDREVLAARGYYQAFNRVEASIQRILEGKNAGQVAQTDHHEWYGELFAPAVTMGIIKRHELAGYRSGPIYIRNSQHTPLPREALLDAMETLFDLLTHEPEAAVRAVLGHHLFVFIHPYFDGNGRIGRFLINAMLASGGYPWTVIRLKRRAQYMAALEAASVNGEIKPLVKFIAQEMRAGTPRTSARRNQ
ncbi:MAG: Fic family protein [Betaproteobacteria bacterium]|nr:Fic family protein [Betaproteobacteria bacterium]